jgi:hypothetical protein
MLTKRSGHAGILALALMIAAGSPGFAADAPAAAPAPAPAP